MAFPPLLNPKTRGTIAQWAFFLTSRRIFSWEKRREWKRGSEDTRVDSGTGGREGEASGWALGLDNIEKGGGSLRAMNYGAMESGKLEREAWGREKRGLGGSTMELESRKFERSQAADMNREGRFILETCPSFWQLASTLALYSQVFTFYSSSFLSWEGSSPSPSSYSSIINSSQSPPTLLSFSQGPRLILLLLLLSHFLLSTLHSIFILSLALSYI